MSDNLLEIDKAMNMIKEDIIRELSESVLKKNDRRPFKDVTTNSLSFSDKSMD